MNVTLCSSSFYMHLVVQFWYKWKMIVPEVTYVRDVNHEATKQTMLQIEEYDIVLMNQSLILL